MFKNFIYFLGQARERGLTGQSSRIASGSSSEVGESTYSFDLEEERLITNPPEIMPVEQLVGDQETREKTPEPTTSTGVIAIRDDSDDEAKTEQKRDEKADKGLS